MEGLRRKGVVGLVTVIVVIMAMVNVSESTLHKVGSARGWIPGFNYTEWSSGEHFYVGDWLLFVFDKHMYNVLEVNETSYTNCNDQNFIANITRGGRDVTQLTEARPYYFLSSGGYCWNGMKVALNVEEVPVTPAPSPTKSSSPSNIGRHMFLSFAIYAALAFSTLLKLI